MGTVALEEGMEEQGVGSRVGVRIGGLALEKEGGDDGIQAARWEVGCGGGIGEESGDVFGGGGGGGEGSENGVGGGIAAVEVKKRRWWSWPHGGLTNGEEGERGCMMYQ
jgi:hypothetical protein